MLGPGSIGTGPFKFREGGGKKKSVAGRVKGKNARGAQGEQMS